MSRPLAMTEAERGFARAWHGVRERGGRGPACDPATSAPLTHALEGWRASGPASGEKVPGISDESEAYDARTLLSGPGAAALTSLTRLGSYLVASMRPEAPLRPLMELTLGLPKDQALELRTWLLSPPKLCDGLQRRVQETYVRLIGSHRSPDRLAELGLFFVAQVSALRHPGLGIELRGLLDGRLRARQDDFEKAARRSSRADLVPAIEEVIVRLLAPRTTEPGEERCEASGEDEASDE
ncbi:hypothetical protein DL240_01525 [Lujinxingia litoralis]|uniref:Uncharacterized protein n=1 Tax=Lujinxingia litoralis TaxID=2211119 RepID=A0A328CB43_9DELT|nr:hypothetical protein [Lujinxingia litoralis]RAL24916.1 hypothetical protein DL240_01525 [Lujinxingia litoralis]